MKALFLAFHVYRYLAVVSLSLGLEACATDTTTFLNYGNPPSNAPLPPREQLMAAPAVSDGLAINYANSVEIIMRCKATQNRITREVSSTAQIGLAAFGGVGAALNWSKATLTILGLGSAAMPELQRIFDAKGRAEAYNQAAELIHDGVLEYYAHNSEPSSTEFTPNGVTLVKKVSAAINLVNDTITGHLPSQKQMQEAIEPMSPEGTTVQNPEAPPVNLIPANGKAPVRKLKPVIIEKTVVSEVGLQSDQLLAITIAAGAILKKSTVPQAQAVADKVAIGVAPGQDPREALSQVLGGSSITASKATDILKELQKQVPQ